LFENIKKYLPFWGEPAWQNGMLGAVKKKKADSKGTSFMQLIIILFKC